MKIFYIFKILENRQNVNFFIGNFIFPMKNTSAFIYNRGISALSMIRTPENDSIRRGPMDFGLHGKVAARIALRKMQAKGAKLIDTQSLWRGFN